MWKIMLKRLSLVPLAKHFCVTKKVNCCGRSALFIVTYGIAILPIEAPPPNIAWLILMS